MNFLKSLLVALILMAATENRVFSQSVNSSATTDSSKVITLKVKGITCAMDLKTISINVERLNGVSSCKAGKAGPTSSFEIKYNPTSVTETDIHFAIENTGGCEDPNEKPYKVKK